MKNTININEVTVLEIKITGDYNQKYYFNIEMEDKKTLRGNIKCDPISMCCEWINDRGTVDQETYDLIKPIILGDIESNFKYVHKTKGES